MPSHLIFGVRSVATIAATTLVYVVVAELTGFDLIVVRQPEFHQVAHRAQEIMFVWTLACLLYGWRIALQGRMRSRKPNPVLVAFVPIVIGIGLAAYKAWTFVLWPFGSNVGPADSELQWILLEIATTLWIAGVGAILAYSLVYHGRIWRRYAEGYSNSIRHCKRYVQ